MSTPIVILTGKAGCGKDTVAEFMVRDHGAAAIAQADPMKRFGRDAFGFTEQQLWGPSECRNALDPRPREDIVNKVWQAGQDEVWAKWLTDIGFESRFGLTNSIELLRDYVKNFIAFNTLNGCDLTPRYVLQTLGTEFGRAAWSDVWVDYAQNKATELLNQGGLYDRTVGRVPCNSRPKFVVITDGRFPNEIVATKLRGGKAFRIDPGTPVQGLAGAAGQHASETEQNSIPDGWFDAILVNDKTFGLQACRHATADLAKYVLGHPDRIYTSAYKDGEDDE